MNQDRTITLNNGIKMPVIGLGVWQAGSGTEQAVLWALEAGYRLIDTAMIYGNETEVGSAIKKSDIQREEIFVTTKLWRSDFGYESALLAIDESLNRLGMSYVDLYLIHWPDADYDIRSETWNAMEEIYHSGKAKSIGVSNYSVELLQEMKEYAGVVAAVNQVEFHPFDYKNELMDYCHENGIALEAYSPLMRGHNLNDPRITAIAQNHGKSNAQVVLRWSIQHGNIVIPKSVHRERIIENINIFDFKLSEGEMKGLDNL